MGLGLSLENIQVIEERKEYCYVLFCFQNKIQEENLNKPETCKVKVWQRKSMFI